MASNLGACGAGPGAGPGALQMRWRQPHARPGCSASRTATRIQPTVKQQQLAWHPVILVLRLQRLSQRRTCLGALAPAATASSYRFCASPAMAAEMSLALTYAPCSAVVERRHPAISRESRLAASATSAARSCPLYAALALHHTHPGQQGLHSETRLLEAACRNTRSLACALSLASAESCRPGSLAPAAQHSTAQTAPHPQRQRDGQAAGAAPRVADGRPLHPALLVQPAQHLLHCLRVALPDVQLHLQGGAGVGHMEWSVAGQVSLGAAAAVQACKMAHTGLQIVIGNVITFPVTSGPAQEHNGLPSTQLSLCAWRKQAAPSPTSLNAQHPKATSGAQCPPAGSRPAQAPSPGQAAARTLLTSSVSP